MSSTVVKTINLSEKDKKKISLLSLSLMKYIVRGSRASNDKIQPDAVKYACSYCKMVVPYDDDFGIEIRTQLDNLCFGEKKRDLESWLETKEYQLKAQYSKSENERKKLKMFIEGFVPNEQEQFEELWYVLTFWYKRKMPYETITFYKNIDKILEDTGYISFI